MPSEGQQASRPSGRPWALSIPGHPWASPAETGLLPPTAGSGNTVSPLSLAYPRFGKTEGRQTVPLRAVRLLTPVLPAEAGCPHAPSTRSQSSQESEARIARAPSRFLSLGDPECVPEHTILTP